MLTKEEKQELKMLRDYERGVANGSIPPVDVPEGGNILEAIINQYSGANPWEAPGQTGDVLQKGADLAKEMIKPKNVGSMAASEVMGRAGRAAGEKLGSIVPGGPIPKFIATKALGFGGEIGGRLAGAYGGGMLGQAAQDVVTGQGGPNDIDTWFNQLHKTGVEQLEGEALSVPLGWAAKGATKLAREPGSLDVQALAKYQQDMFKRAWDLWKVSPPPRSVLGAGELTEEAAQNAIETGGLTVAEKSFRRLYDLMQGMAAGSWLGGGRMRRYGESREKMFHLSAERLGEDVGPLLDQADLARIIQGGEARKELGALGKGRQGLLDALEIDEKEAIKLLNTLQIQAKGYNISIKNLGQRGKTAIPGFDFVHQWDGEDVPIRVYRQVRDQLMKTVRSTSVIPPEVRGEATRLVRQWDKSALRSLPGTAVKTLQDLQALETGIYNDYIKDGFIRGILSDGDVARSWVNGLVSKPDYINVLKVMKKVDPATQDNIRRAVINKTLSTAMLPGGRLSAQAFRRNVEENIGWKALREITGAGTAKEVNRFVHSLEYIESLYGRGEAARVMTSLTQGTVFMRMARDLGTAASGAAAVGYLSGGIAPGLAAGALVLLTPWGASHFLTSPLAGRYVRFAKAMNKPKVQPAWVAQELRKLGGFVMDNHVVERLIGRGAVQWGKDPGDAELTEYLVGKSRSEDPRQTGTDADGRPTTGPSPQASPPGQAFVMPPDIPEEMRAPTQ